MTLPLVLEEGRAPHIVSRMLYLACGLVAAFVVWLSVTEVRELAVATGQLQPTGLVQPVQHLEGGIVAEILVREGDIVEAGAPLVNLRPAEATSIVAQSRIREATLALQIERQTAALENRAPDFGSLGEDYPDLARVQTELYEAERAQAAQRESSLISRVEQKFVEVQTLDAEIESIRTQLEIDRERLAIREELLEKGLSSRAEMLRVKREHERTNASLITTQGRLQSAQEALNEASIELLEGQTEYRKRVNTERAEAAAELAELIEARSRQEDRVDRLAVVAPVRGIVQSLSANSLGQVIQPGEKIAQIVPLDEDLVAEVRVAPNDIGYVRVGLSAAVKVTTFDPARFGSIEGTVEHISATTLMNEQGDPYYRALIQLKSDHVGQGETQHVVLPGMVVNAEIVTGSKSILRYLLKPVFRSLDIAFTER